MMANITEIHQELKMKREMEAMIQRTIWSAMPSYSSAERYSDLSSFFYWPWQSQHSLWSSTAMTSTLLRSELEMRNEQSRCHCQTTDDLGIVSLLKTTCEATISLRSLITSQLIRSPIITNVPFIESVGTDTKIGKAESSELRRKWNESVMNEIQIHPNQDIIQGQRDSRLKTPEQSCASSGALCNRNAQKLSATASIFQPRSTQQ